MCENSDSLATKVNKCYNYTLKMYCLIKHFMQTENFIYFIMKIFPIRVLLKNNNNNNSFKTQLRNTNIRKNIKKSSLDKIYSAFYISTKHYMHVI